jgi:hypothetical protein
MPNHAREAHNTNISRKLYKRKLSENKGSFSLRSAFDETENSDLIKNLL